MELKETTKRFVNRIGSLFPFNRGKIQDDLNTLIEKREDDKRYVSLSGRPEWELLRDEINDRINILSELGFRYMADPVKFHNQAVDCSARRDELKRLLDNIEQAPQRLEELNKKINELYEITRSNPT